MNDMIQLQVKSSIKLTTFSSHFSFYWNQAILLTRKIEVEASRKLHEWRLYFTVLKKGLLFN